MTFSANRHPGPSGDSSLRGQPPLRDALDEPQPNDRTGRGEGGQADRRLSSNATGDGRSTGIKARPNPRRRGLDVPDRGESLRSDAAGRVVPVPPILHPRILRGLRFPGRSSGRRSGWRSLSRGVRHEQDRKRDWILGRAGWTVKRFHGTTIYHKADNCAYVVRREVEGRRAMVAAAAREAEIRRQARREAFLRPFRTIARLFKRNRRV